MSVEIYLMIGAFGVFVGFLTGATSIGGVLLVPALVYGAGLDIRVAIAAAMFGYFFTGAVGAALFARHGSIAWRAVAWLSLGAAACAFLGAGAVNVFPAGALEAGIAALVLFAGWQALRPEPATAGRVPGAAVLTGLGGGVGFVSAVTGTGGPVTLAPVLLWLDVPVLTVIGLSQAIMMPIGAAATLGNALYGTLDVVLGGVIASGLAAGAVGGATFAHLVPKRRLKQFLAAALIAIGLAMLARLGFTLL